jgi:broad specificity phosphatase PhoE
LEVSSRQQCTATARVILICHGSTEAVRAAKFPADEPLDDPGLKTIKALADALPQAGQCWTGPERRTRQTAQALGLNAQIEPLLRDCDYGAWAGRTFDEVHAHEPDAASAWLRDPAAAPHGGETISAVIQRVGQWLAGEQARGQRAIVVTHPAIVRAAIVHAIEAAPQSFWRIDIAPLSVTRLSSLGGRWNLSAAGCMAIKKPI